MRRGMLIFVPAVVVGFRSLICCFNCDRARWFMSTMVLPRVDGDCGCGCDCDCECECACDCDCECGCCNSNAKHDSSPDPGPDPASVKSVSCPGSSPCI